MYDLMYHMMLTQIHIVCICDLYFFLSVYNKNLVAAELISTIKISQQRIVNSFQRNVRAIIQVTLCTVLIHFTIVS